MTSMTNQPAEAIYIAFPIVRVVEHWELGVVAGLLSDSTGVLGALAIFRVLVVDYDRIFGIIALGTSALKKEKKAKGKWMVGRLVV